MDLTSDGGYIIAGDTYSYSDGSRDCWLLKLGPDGLPVEDQANPFQPASFTLSCYPNPFNSTTTLRFDVPLADDVNLAIYDITGRVVKTFSEHYSAGTHEVAFDASALPSGLFFAKVETSSGLSASTKLLFLR